MNTQMSYYLLLLFLSHSNNFELDLYALNVEIQKQNSLKNKNKLKSNVL